MALRQGAVLWLVGTPVIAAGLLLLPDDPAAGALVTAAPPSSSRAPAAELTATATPDTRPERSLATSAALPPREVLLGPIPREVRAWIDDLRDDQVAGNAGWAIARLRRAWSAEVRAALGEALLSRDRQQRHLAAVLLRDGDAHPTPELCTVSVEALNREVSRALIATLGHEGVAGAARYLARHAPAALTALRYGLGSTDAQQRFLCAFLLACAGERADAGLIARELIAHLGDNEIAGDAMMAAHGLYRLARSAPVALHSWLPHVDGQARSLLELVALDLEAPPRDRRELVARRRLHRVPDVYHDPVLEFDIERSRVPTW